MEQFIKKSVAEFNAMAAEDQVIYAEKKASFDAEQTVGLIKSVESLEKRKESLELELKTTKEAFVKLGTEVEKLKTVKSTPMEVKSAFAQEFEAKSEAITSYLDGKTSSVALELKADVDYGDLTQTGVLNQLAPGISDIVKKVPRVAQLFSRIPMVTENYTYLEQTTVVRGAKGEAVCAKGFTSLTKEEIGEQTVKYVKIKDTTDICKDYAGDYGFVENRYRTLLNDSINFKIDTELLLGTDSSTSTNSIDAVSSEFSATNVAAPIDLSVKLANMSDLILGMSMQIDVLGKLANFKSNVALVSRADFFKNVESAKDTTGQYLDPRLTKVGGNWFIGDILIIPLVDVPSNELYVMDTTKGAILDRSSVSLTMSDSNGTNFVDEYVTMMVVAKLQFLVENNNIDAFMKCTDVDAAIIAITKA